MRSYSRACSRSCSKRESIQTRCGLRYLLRYLLLCVAVLFHSSVVMANDPDAERWEGLKQAMFGDRSITEGDDVIALDAPSRAHDAAVVPIVVRSMDPGRSIKQVHLVVDKNPLPLAGIFNFTEEAGDWRSFETRIRINEYTHVRAIGELTDGSLHMTSRFVKAAGGCSAPAMGDLEAAIARAGKMKILIDEIKEESTQTAALSSPVEAKASAVIKISHPNNSGMQFDQVSRNYIPAFFVHTIGAEINGRPLLNVETNFSLSENPVVRLSFSPEVDHSEITAFAVDSKGNRYEQSLDFDGAILQ